ncbi:MAG: hypothetical protein WBA77_21770 [Microcoleaceae cyanobacterium]
MGDWSVNWEKVKVKGKVLGFDEISDAPPQPGLYAWYANLGLGAADLADEGQTRRALEKQTQKYKPVPLQVDIKGNFGSRWVGKLSDSSIDDLGNALLNQTSDNTNSEGSHSPEKQRGQKLCNALAESATRQALISTLEECIPIFLSPLYVGISDNLQQRLQHHVRQFRLVARKSKSQNEYLTSDLDTEASGTEFAMRAVNAKFKEDNLKAFIFPVPNIENLNPTEVRNVIEGVEFLLNRWVRPSLGVK